MQNEYLGIILLIGLLVVFLIPTAMYYNDSSDTNISGSSGQVPFLNEDGNRLIVQEGFDFNQDTNQLSAPYFVGNGSLLTDLPASATLDTNVWTANLLDDNNVWQTDINVGSHNLTDVLSLLLDSNYTPPTEPGALIWWNPTEMTLNISTGLGPVQQVGHEIYILVYNSTGTTIPNGSAVYPVGGFQGAPSVALANSSTFKTIARAVVIATMNIPNNGFGLATRFGKVRDINTSAFSLDNTLWVSPDVNGGFVNKMPEFPDYTIQVGGVTKIGATDGEIIVDIVGQPIDTKTNFWNGTFRESIDFNVSSNGSIITGSLSPKNGHPNITMMFSDGFSELITTPAATVTLTAGTDINPQQNFIYVPKSTKTLTASISEWPSEEHIKVATVVLQSASTTQNLQPLKNHNWNDEIQDTNQSQGHLSHITQRLRQEQAKWDTGTEGSITINTAPSPDDVYFSNTSGFIYQLHRQTFPALDMNTGERIFVPNHPTTAYLDTNNLNVLTVDASGNTLVNRYFSLVVWGVVNARTQKSKLMVNLPTNSYTGSTLAINDASNYSVYNIPKIFEGVGFLIGRYTFRLQAGGNWTLEASEDLRGRIPNVSAGGTGGTGATSFLGLTDTPNSYSGNTRRLVQVSPGETALEFTNEIYVNNIFADGNVSIDNNLSSLNSVIQNNLTVDTNTLFVDATNNRVGIKNPRPIKDLHIFGKVYNYKDPNVPNRNFLLNNLWTIRDVPNRNRWKGIVWSSELGLFVAVSFDGNIDTHVMTSPDGINWTARTASANSGWNSVEWSPELGLFVAVASTGTNRIMTSPDGINWTNRTAPVSSTWAHVEWSPEVGLFVAVCTNGAVITSPDGINWTQRTTPSAFSFFETAWSPELGLFASVSNNGGTQSVMTSPDGINWTLRTTPNQQWSGIAWSPELKLYAAVAQSGTGNRVMTSPDGINWTNRTTPVDNLWDGIEWSPELGLFAAVALSGDERLMTSSDGVNWTAKQIHRFVLSPNQWFELEWSPELGIFVSVSDSTDRGLVITSPKVNIWNQNNNLVFLFDPDNNVGIGKNSPTQKLDVNGNIVASGWLHSDSNLLCDSSTCYTISDLNLQNPVTDTNVWSEGWLSDVNSLTQDLNGGNNSLFNFVDGNFTRNLSVDGNTLYVDSTNDKVGINTLNPSFELDVKGKTLLNGTNPATEVLVVKGAAAHSDNLQEWKNWLDALLASVSANGDFFMQGLTAEGNVALGNAVSDTLTINAGTTTLTEYAASSGLYTDASKRLTTTPPTSGILGYWNRIGTTLSPATATDFLAIDTDTLYVDSNNDMVGIGTLNPNQALDVNGSVKVSDTYLFDNGSTQSVPGEPNIHSGYIVSSKYKQDLNLSSYPNPSGIFFRRDGLRLYFTSGSSVHQFNLSTAWNLSTADFNQSFSVAAQEPIPFGIFFRSDGKKMYVAGNGNRRVNEYDLSTAWDISTASFKQFFSIAAQNLNPVGSINFRPDGKKMYVTANDAGNDEVIEYDLNTKWDISTSVFKQKFAIAIDPTGTYFKPDGTRMYITGLTGSTVYEYILSTPWDISTSVANGNTFNYAAQETLTFGLFFHPLLTKMYVTGWNSDAIHEYNLGFIIEDSNVGIGTTNPTQDLDVNGDVNISGFASVGSLQIPSDANQEHLIYATGPILNKLYISNRAFNNSLNQLMIGTNNVVVNEQNYDVDFLVNGISKTLLFIDANNGNVGIGTQTPSQELEVVGDVNASGAIYSYSNQLCDSTICYTISDLNLQNPVTDTNVWSEGWLSDVNSLTQDLNGGNNSLFNFADGNFSGDLNVGTSVYAGEGVYSAGIKWELQTPADNNAWKGVAYGNGLFVTVSTEGNNRIMTSPDGVNWTAITAPVLNTWEDITFGRGLFVAVAQSGSGNRVMTSPDGNNWTIRTSAEDNDWEQVVYGNGLFVATASSGTNRVMTSPDGINWTARTGQANTWEGLTFGNGLFVAVGGGGPVSQRIMTSSDGINWTYRTAAASVAWQSVTYGNGLFVAVGSSGSNNGVMTSPDGINWTSRTSASINGWTGVEYGEGLFVAVSDSGSGLRVMTSVNGINWFERGDVNAGSWKAVVYGNGLFVAVGDNGTGERIMTSGKTTTNFTSHDNVYQGNIELRGDLNVTKNVSIDNNLSIDTDTLFVDAANDRVGVNLSNPSYPLDVSGNSRITGDLILRSGTNSAALIKEGVNVANNVQLWFGDIDSDGSTTEYFNRFGSASGYAYFDVVRGDGTTFGAINLGTPGGSKVAIGETVGIDATPSSLLWVKGNASIGSSYKNNAAPTNGLLVEGSVGIGTTVPQDALTVIGDVNVSGCYQLTDGTTVGGSCVSDSRLKTNVSSLQSSLDKILSLNPVKFDWIPELNVDDNMGKRINNVGFVAQEFEQVFPNLVNDGNDGFKRVTYGSAEVDAHVVGAIKEQQELIVDLNAENNLLKKQLDALIKRIEVLEGS